MARSWQRDRAALSAVALMAIALIGPGAAVAATSSAPPAGQDPAPGALQALIDAAPPGAVVVIPPGIYREEVKVDRPLTLRGDQAEIRGSDVWSDWHPDGDRWRSEASVPKFTGGGICRDPRCAWPEQVFLDGRPIEQVAANPAAGQFSIDLDRRVVLADDPTGRLVEVTVRERWMTVTAPDVTVEGFTMRDAASPPQHGALQALPGADRLVVRHVRLSDSHGALISFQGVTGASLVSSDLMRGGQLGVHAGGDGTTDLTIEGNRIADSNTEGFDPAWEAGGLKASIAANLRVVDNEVVGNDGPGIWCDIGCRDFTASGNRVDGNTRAGIMFEISDGATIEGNVVWENGWGHPTWGWGAGILVSSSSGATIRGNVLAWNADGITVISQIRNRPGGDGVRHVEVLDNTVISDAAGGYLLGWLQDWQGAMYGAESGNLGSGNRFWHEPAEPSTCRFEWSGCIDSLAAFAATPGGQLSTYLSADQERAALAAAGAPPQPLQHPFGEPPRWRTVLQVAAVGGLVALGLIAIVVTWFRIRNRRRRSPSGSNP